MDDAIDWRAIVAKVEAAIEESYPGDAARPRLVNALAGHAARATTAWPLSIDYRPGDVDRRGDLLSGPLYTSDAFPWPRNNERWLDPVLQVSLDRWGVRSGWKVGTGLLQLWEAKTGGYIRVVPSDALAAEPTPPPSVRISDFEVSIGSYDWDTKRPEWLDQPGRITSFGNPLFDAAPWHLYRCIRIIADPAHNEGAPEPAALLARLRAIIDQIGEPASDDRHRAFGMCGGNIFQTAEDLFLPPILVTIESDHRVNSVMGSTLCVCVDSKNGGFVYSSHLFWE